MSVAIAPDKIVFESQAGAGKLVLYAGFPIEGLTMNVPPDASPAELQEAREYAAHYFEEQIVFRMFLTKIRRVRKEFAGELPLDRPTLLPEDYDAFMPLGNSGSYDGLPELREAMAIQEELIATALPLHEAARITGVDEKGLYEFLEEGSLLGVWCAGHQRHHWRVLSFQITASGLLPHVGDILLLMRYDIDPLRAYGFFVTPSPLLVLAGRMVSPRDWLAAGADPRPVVELAKRL